MKMNSSRKKVISVALAVENAIYQAGIARLIRAFDGFNISVAAGTVTEIEEWLEEMKAPDIFLLEINIHEEETREHIRKIRDTWPLTRILILTNYDHPYNIIKAFQSGGNGHLSKECNREELYRALLSIYYTGQYFNETVLTPKAMGGKSVSELTVPITGQELNVLTHFCSELSNEEIAEKLGLTLSIVEGYQGILFDKLKVSTRVGLAVCAYKMGIITGQPDVITEGP